MTSGAICFFFPNTRSILDVKKCKLMLLKKKTNQQTVRVMYFVNDVKMFIAFHFSFEHFNVISLVDKSIDHE